MWRTVLWLANARNYEHAKLSVYPVKPGFTDTLVSTAPGPRLYCTTVPVSYCSLRAAISDVAGFPSLENGVVVVRRSFTRHFVENFSGTWSSEVTEDEWIKLAASLLRRIAQGIDAVKSFAYRVEDPIIIGVLSALQDERVPLDTVVIAAELSLVGSW